MGKNLITGLLVVIVLVGAFIFFNGGEEQEGPDTHADSDVAMEDAMEVKDAMENIAKDAEGEDVAGIMDNAMEYAVVSEDSTLEWLGHHIATTGNSHSGTVGISEGTVYVSEAGDIVGGTITIDMADMKEYDKNGVAQSDIGVITHVKSEDFFNVERFPTASFEITSVTALDVTEVGAPNASVTGDLTIKGETHEITFPAVLTDADNTLSAKATFSIDRTRWGVQYASDKFFKGLGDKIIDDEIDYTLEITAEKQDA